MILKWQFLTSCLSKTLINYVSPVPRVTSWSVVTFFGTFSRRFDQLIISPWFDGIFKSLRFKQLKPNNYWRNSMSMLPRHIKKKILTDFHVVLTNFFDVTLMGENSTSFRCIFSMQFRWMENRHNFDVASDMSFW